MRYQTIIKGFYYLREHGAHQTWKRFLQFRTDLKNKPKKIYFKSTRLEFKLFLDFLHKLDQKISFKSEKPIDIIIPVYNGIEFLDTLFESIFNNTTVPYRLIICDDNSSDEKVWPFLKELKKRNFCIDIILIENEQNLGFVKTVNKLVKYTNNHFVLLNTDVEVPKNWIERLMYPIFNLDNIASTTPFTNAGTICSFPNYLEDNIIFENMTVTELDDFFKKVNFFKTYIQVPTGVGFCMGVNKIVVEKIGMFDEIFGKGYGEENDWCQRAIEVGYKNIHVTNLFVYHKHGGSFHSDEKKKLISNNLDILSQKHSNYHKQIQLFIKKDELKNLRDIIKIKIKNKSLYTIFIIDHKLGGGANNYIDEGLESRLDKNQMIILLRFDFLHNKHYDIEIKYGDEAFIYYSKKLSDLFDILKCFSIDEIFVNSLVSYPNIHNTIEQIIQLKLRTEAKLVMPIHDFHQICPSFNLLNQHEKYCEVPDSTSICDMCLKENKNEFKKFEKECDIHLWRESWSNILDISDEIIVFSNSSKDILLKAYPKYTKRISVIPHDISGRYTKIYKKSDQSSIKVIGVLGGINKAKGAKVVEKLLKIIDEKKINARVVLIGQISIPIDSPFFEVTGRYDKNKLPEIIKKYKIDQFFIPSIWPETFSYTTDEIMQMGYPLVVFDMGAPAERVKTYKKGKVISLENFEEVLFD